mmetsp:Transcript_13929/g.50724  ORF Transcript_13929/g.50724 Transcript_13929/m.50724 type:complete len:347 (+) Transcript_13929:125-1165(+)
MAAVRPVYRMLLREIKLMRDAGQQIRLRAPVEKDWGWYSFVQASQRRETPLSAVLPGVASEFAARSNFDADAVEAVVKSEFRKPFASTRPSADNAAASVSAAADTRGRVVQRLMDGVRNFHYLKRRSKCVSVTTTEGVQIELTTDVYSEDDLHWSYRVRVTNTRSTGAIRVVSRYWAIKDAFGNIVSTISGEGIVGQQPIVRAGRTFEYVSGVELPTLSGSIGGHFTCEELDQATETGFSEHTLHAEAAVDENDEDDGHDDGNGTGKERKREGLAARGTGTNGSAKTSGNLSSTSGAGSSREYSTEATSKLDSGDAVHPKNRMFEAQIQDTSLVQAFPAAVQLSDI